MISHMLVRQHGPIEEEGGDGDEKDLYPMMSNSFVATAMNQSRRQDPDSAKLLLGSYSLCF
jgi:hypothetical protein